MGTDLENQRFKRLKSHGRRCWKYDWVLEFDIKGLFDNIDHDLFDAGGKKTHGL